jgi:ABC-type uncharacterized transport system permease subunit
LKGISYTGYDAMRGNGEGEPLLVEMTPARQYPAKLKYSNQNCPLSQKIYLPVKLVVGWSSSEINERMGRVPIWKFLI